MPPSVSVLHVAQPSDGGVADVVLDLAADQMARGWDVAVACDPRGWLGGQTRARGVTVMPWTATRSPGRGVASETRQLSRVIGQVDPQVVVLHSAKAGLCGRLAIRGRRPTVFMPHAWSFQAVSGLQHLLAVRWERLGARWTAAVVCVSTQEQRVGLKAGVRARCEVIPNGIDLKRWSPADDDARRDAREALGLSPGPLAVCVGRLCEQKGQDLLLTAWPAVDVPEARLVLVGDGPSADALRRTVPAGVSLVGHQDDVALWLAAADVVVAPSRWEAHALVPLQAAARERCVVAFNVEGMALTLGDDAALVPPGDVSALATALKLRLLDEALRQAEARRARARVAEKFDSGVSRERMAMLLAQLTRDQALAL